MKEQDKQKAMRGRDLFNENITPLRDAYPTIKKVQDVMNRDINKAIYDVPIPPPPPPTKPMLDADLHYHRLRKIYSAYFLRGGLTLKPNMPNHPVLKHYTDKAFKEVIDKIAQEDLSNVIRVIGMASFHADTLGVNQHLAPHPIDSNGISDLHVIYKPWEDQTKWRLEYMVERGLTVRYIFNDQCSINGWSWHWLNQEKNHGWHGKPTYRDRYGWFHWVHLGDPNYGTKKERAEYEATMGYIKDRREYVIDNILKPLRPYIIWDNNEVWAGSMWHNQEADFLESKFPGRKFRITSVGGYEWFHTKNSIPGRWMIESHGINTVELYNEKQAFLRSGYIDEKGHTHAPVAAPFLPSADGFGDNAWMDAGPAEIAKLLRWSLYDGNLGFQGNSEGVWDDMNPKIAKVGAAMRDAFSDVA